MCIVLLVSERNKQDTIWGNTIGDIFLCLCIRVDRHVFFDSDILVLTWFDTSHTPSLNILIVSDLYPLHLIVLNYQIRSSYLNVAGHS